MLNDLYQIIEVMVHLNTPTHPLIELLQKEDDFDWTGNCNKVFGKLKLYMNSDTCRSYFDIEYNLHRRHPICGISTILLQKKERERRP